MSSNEPDATLRRALDPPPEAVERAVAGALASAAQPGRRRRWISLAAAAAVAAGALIAVLVARTPEGPPASGEAPAPSVLLITNRRGPVTVESSAGPALVILSGGMP